MATVGPTRFRQRAALAGIAARMYHRRYTSVQNTARIGCRDQRGHSQLRITFNARPIIQTTMSVGHQGSGTAQDMLVTVEDVSRFFIAKRRGHEAKFWALKHVSFDVADGEMLTIIGPSGCGKSTVLNCIAGLTRYDEGTITLDGTVVRGPGPERAVVFQHASLLPWRTVEHNVGFGLALQRQVPRQQHPERVRKALELVGLSNFKDHYPAELSGGMQQRVNLARALATEPDLLLMDEPFGSLDQLTRRSVGDLLLQLWWSEDAQARKTVLFVTHDTAEAILLADEVWVLSPRPCRLLSRVPVSLQRPRGRSLITTPEFQRVVRQVEDILDTGAR